MTFSPARPRPLLLALLLILLLPLAAAGAATDEQRGWRGLPAALRGAMNEAGLPPQSLSLLVMPRQRGGPRLAYLPDLPRQPASTMKTLTTAAALEQLGPAFRWHTRLLTEAPLQEGALAGPLYVQGEGDPDFTVERLRGLLAQLKAQGLTQLDGDLVLDRSRFSPERPDLGQPPFDNHPDAHYNVVPDALLLSQNLVLLHSDGTPAGLRLVDDPPLAGVSLDASALEWAAAPCSRWDEDWQAPQATQDGGVWTLHLRGRLASGCSTYLLSNALDRNAYWEAAFRAAWTAIGGRWNGHVRDGHVPPAARVLAETASDELADIVRRINKPSDNTMARLLFLDLAPPGAPNSAEAAAGAVRQWLQQHGIATDGVLLDNGSGLSREERLSVRQLAAVLRAAVAGDTASEFESSLPIVGRDGTMKRRLLDSPAAGRGHVKTGTLDTALGVAGFVRDQAGRDWIVAGLVNAPDAHRGRAVLDALIDWVAKLH